MYHLYILPSLVIKMSPTSTLEMVMNEATLTTGSLAEVTLTQFRALALMFKAGDWFDVNRLAQFDIPPASVSRLARTGLVEVIRVSCKGRKRSHWRALSDGLGQLVLRPEEGTLANDIVRRLKTYGQIRDVQTDECPTGNDELADKATILLKCLGWPIRKVPGAGYILEGYLPKPP